MRYAAGPPNAWWSYLFFFVSHTYIVVQKDNRWSISNTKIEGEIHDFEARLNDAEKLFNVQSLVVISGGLDAILQSLSRQSVLARTLKRLHETQQEHWKRFLEEQEQKKYIDDKLNPYTVQDSTYIAQKKQPCNPDTRMEILQEIVNWIYDCSEDAVNPPLQPRLQTNASLNASLVHNSLSIATIITQPTPTLTFPLLPVNSPDVLMQLNGVFMTHSKDSYTQSPRQKKRQNYLLILLAK
ncbi:hypothetical protein C0993_000314 [Termitomyces sp. T159_Od127]|nr:hypothetical protein C0993_000314 [Termitomyces sp. T159_Od127]